MAIVRVSPTLEKSENLKAEILALRKLADAFKNDEDAIVQLRPAVRFSPLYGRTVSPDLVLFKRHVGTALFEVKAWDGEFLKSCSFERGLLKCKGKTFRPPLDELKAFTNDLLSKGVKPVVGLLFLPFLSLKDYEKLPKEVQNLIPKELTLFEDDYVNKTLRLKVLRAFAPFSSIPDGEIERGFRKLKQMLFPDVKIPNKSATLDDVQENLLFSLKKGYRVVRGGPGSGKTVTLIGKALQSVLEDEVSKKTRKVVFLTFGRSLANKVKKDVKTLFKKYGLEHLAGRVEVYTLHEYAGKVFNALYPGKKTQDPLEELSRVENLSVPDKFRPDVLLVDEAQDLKRDWFSFVKALYRDEGVLAFGVDETQRIYPSRDWRWKDTPFPVRGRRVTVLRKIYRTPSLFIRLGVEFLKLDKRLMEELKELKDASWIDSFETVGNSKARLKVLKAKHPLAYAVRVVQNALKVFRPDEVLVLTPTPEKSVRSYLSKFFEVNSSDHFEGGKVNVLSYYRAKGLEAKTVVVLEFDRLFDLKLKDSKEEERRLRRLGFVVLTRAQKELFVLGREERGAFKELLILNGTKVGEEKRG